MMGTMQKRSSKTDFSQDALRVVEQTIGAPLAVERPKNPAAVSLGRLGGLKGGKARAQALSPEKRKAIAKKAAKMRWKTARKTI
jgi:hypothetical protein